MFKLDEFILTFFYCGKSKKAPGTVGSLGAVIFWFIVTKCFYAHQVPLFLQNIFWGIFLIAILVYGIFAIPNYAKQFGQIDHQTIVLDEVLGQIFALQFIFSLIHQNYFLLSDIMIFHLFFCFALFRFFDITKPSFIGHFDKNLKTGFGVMFDDLLCGIVVAGLGAFLLVVFS